MSSSQVSSNPMENYVAEVRMFSTPKIPEYGWLICDGKIYPMSRYQKLFGLIGNQFGGDGVSTFAVPDLRGRLPMGSKKDVYKQGVPGGNSGTTLLPENLPPHIHSVNVIAVAGATSGSPNGAFFGTPSADTAKYYSDGTGGTTAAMDAAMTGVTGKSVPVSNIQPIIGLTFAIAYDGYYPTRP